jgi:hypothetical protein
MPRSFKLFSLLVTFYLESAFPGECDEPADDEPKASTTDLEILEVVLLDLIGNKEFRPLTGHDGKKTQIVLVDETVGPSGFVSDDQLDSLKWFIREEIRADLRQRNPKTLISLADFVPTSDKILVEDLKGLDVGTDFKKKYPDARGHVKAWLPGYSEDGKEAVVMLFCGPTPHGATATYMLVNKDGPWKVKRRNVAYYR